MEYETREVPVHYVEHGEGTPLLVLHGARVDHREVMACLEPVFDGVTGYHRIYPDLPGMGGTPAPETIASADDVLEVLLAFVDGVVGDQPLLLIGHSGGGYFAQAIAARRPEQVVGLAMLCPVLTDLHDVPAHEVVHRTGTIGDAGFRSYFTVHTAQTLDRYTKYVAPANALADQSALSRIGQRWELAQLPTPGAADRRPTLIVTGRQDSTVGYVRAWELLEEYPRATFAVLDRAGHALPHEQPDVLRALMSEWLRRVDEHAAA